MTGRERVLVYRNLGFLSWMAVYDVHLAEKSLNIANGGGKRGFSQQAVLVCARGRKLRIGEIRRFWAVLESGASFVVILFVRAGICGSGGVIGY